MSATITEEAILDWLDFAPVCSVPHCEQAADWWLVCRSCNAHSPWCEPHRRREMLDISGGNPFSRVTCSSCLENVRLRQWQVLFEFVPIGPT